MSSSSTGQCAGSGDNRSRSIAWSITWSFWWRRIVAWIWLDIAIVLIAGGSLLVGYQEAFSDDYGGVGSYTLETIYDGAESWNTGLEIGAVNIFDLGHAVLTMTNADGTKTVQYPVGQILVVNILPFTFIMIACEGVWLIFGLLTTVRRVRKKLKPLNDLALTADALGNASIMSADNIETLEQAIERASVDSPRVSTGVSDLASVEVALNNLLRQMQEAKLQQMRFVSDASHELRTPISVIQGYVGMLDRWGKNDPAVLDESIGALKEESAHMQELVEQLLFLARGDAGRNTLNKAQANLAALVADVEEEFSMIDTTHSYCLTFDEALKADPAYQVNVDVALIKQSMRTIVQNAQKYSEEGTTIKLGVAANSDGVSVSYTIQDEGEGMSAEDVSHIFERFWRSDSARGSSKDGSGLGMAIAKWIVDAHGGSIDVISSKGIGTRFTVVLPK